MELGLQLDIIQCLAGIKSCGQGSAWPWSVALLQRALRLGLGRSEVAVAAAVKASGRWRQALGAAPAVRSALVAACAKDMAWRQAMALLSATVPLAAWNAALKGCWQRALEIFEAMEAKGYEPDVFSYSGLMSSCGRAEQWRGAQVFKMPFLTCLAWVFSHPTA